MAGAAVASILCTYLGLCTLALLAYTVADPPTTGVQIQRRVSAWMESATYQKQYTPVALADISDHLERAAVAAEDSRFYQHTGIDWKAVREAIEERRAGKRQRGGSSITQQLVKNLFMTTHSTLVRKALEVPLTYAAELILSKDRILELYLNVIEWGPGIYGAEAAAQHHYGTSAQTLSRYQSAALAACIPNPLQRTPQTMDWYARIILQRMDILAGNAPSNAPVPSKNTRRSSADTSASAPDTTPTKAKQPTAAESDTLAPRPPEALSPDSTHSDTTTNPHEQ